MQAGIFLDGGLESQDIGLDDPIVSCGELVNVELDVELVAAEDQADDELLGGGVEVGEAVSEEVFDQFFANGCDHNGGSGQNLKDNHANTEPVLDRMGDVLEGMRENLVKEVGTVEHWVTFLRIPLHGRQADVREAKLFAVLRDLDG